MKLIHGGLVSPVGSSDIADGSVVVDGTDIIAVGPFTELSQRFPRADYLDYRDCAILPGLVNAHTHLELSHFAGRVPFRGSFVDWVDRLQTARSCDTTAPSAVIGRACRESIRSGVTTVGDISFANQSRHYLKEQPVRKRIFAEVFGITADMDSPRYYLEACIETAPTDELLRQGLSPHAPYSAGPAVYRIAADLAANSGNTITLSTHLAENREEEEFLLTGGGPWLRYLKKLDKWDGSFKQPGMTPVSYFLSLPLPDVPFALAHVNYPTESEIRALAQSHHSVIYCPRSHDFFGHPEHPFRRMLEAGVTVCLGTDSLASNTSLSILDEIRFLHQRCRDLPAATLVQMATLNGVVALGWDDRTGVLEAGKAADLIALPGGDAAAVTLDSVLFSTSQPRLTMMNGAIVHAA